MVKAVVSDVSESKVQIVIEDLNIQKEAYLTEHVKNIKIGDKVICLGAGDMDFMAVLGVIKE